MSERPRLRMFILGAGFSAAAGMPLARELWTEILAQASKLEGRAEKFGEDLEKYTRFCADCFGERIEAEAINFEKFMEYLDVEHVLGLRGSDTWSDEGNEGTIVTKVLIGKILSERQRSLGSIPQAHLDFASRLVAGDWVITFNYDTLLEQALEAVGRPYRLYANRYREIREPDYAVCDDDDDEVVLLKVHGSIDWFDRSVFDLRCQSFGKFGIERTPYDPIFSQPERFGLAPLTSGPRFSIDPLRNVYRARDVAAIYASDDIWFMVTPRILAPSAAKLAYATRMGDMWQGAGRAGIFNTDLAIVGYSLPNEDNYARQILHSIVTNYQRRNWNKAYVAKKNPLVMIDYFASPQHEESYRNRYRFVDWEKTRLVGTGLNEATVGAIFEPAQS